MRMNSDFCLNKKFKYKKKLINNRKLNLQIKNKTKQNQLIKQNLKIPK